MCARVVSVSLPRPPNKNPVCPCVCVPRFVFSSLCVLSPCVCRTHIALTGCMRRTRTPRRPAAQCNRTHHPRPSMCPNRKPRTVLRHRHHLFPCTLALHRTNLIPHPIQSHPPSTFSFPVREHPHTHTPLATTLRASIASVFV